MKTAIRVIAAAAVLALLSSCSTINSRRAGGFSYCNGTWGIATFTNNTDVPQAGTRATSITAGVLRSKGIVNIAMLQANKTCNELIVCPNMSIPMNEVRRFGQEHHIRYMMVGAVNEWQYKVGLDGEPVSSVSLQVIDTERNQIVWTSVGSRIGSSHSGLSTTAQDLINTMLKSL